MRRPRTIRGRLLLAVMVAAAVLTAIATLAFAFALAHALSDDADDVARLQSTRELGNLDVRGDSVAIKRRPRSVDALVWLLEGDRVISAPNVDPALGAAVMPYVRSGTDFVDVPGQNVRLHAAPIKDAAGRRVGTVVVGISLAPFRGTQHASLTIWLISAGVLLIGVFLVSRWLIDSTLRPVALMTADAEAWSTADMHQRFAHGEPRDELDRLAVTLDGLLDRLAASLRREQLFALELSHELRTPLARLLAEADMALRRQRSEVELVRSLEAVRDDGRQMATIVETLMVAAREEASSRRGSSDPGEVLSDVIDAGALLAAERGVDFAVAPIPADVRLGVDAAYAVRVISPLAENAVRFAASSVRLAVRRDGPYAAISVEDDGPGLVADERERVFEPGVRGSAAARPGAPAGAGLGLALSRRLAQAVSGDVETEEAQVGARFVARLPLGVSLQTPPCRIAGSRPGVAPGLLLEGLEEGRLLRTLHRLLGHLADPLGVVLAIDDTGFERRRLLGPDGVVGKRAIGDRHGGREAHDPVLVERLAGPVLLVASGADLGMGRHEDAWLRSLDTRLPASRPADHLARRVVLPGSFAEVPNVALLVLGIPVPGPFDDMALLGKRVSDHGGRHAEDVLGPLRDHVVVD
jgi:signal transduction histidine kinase